jgi:hypothetical protein
VARAVFVLWLLATVSLTAQGPPVPEYEAKLAFLYSFLKYVEWPGPANAPILVCVAGQNPFGRTALLETMRDQVNGREVTAEEILEPDERCNVVFVPETAKGGYVREAKGKPVLLVGESDDFLKEGGIIRFVEHKGKLRFEIDVEAAQRAKLRISPSLLRLRHNAGGAQEAK